MAQQASPSSLSFIASQLLFILLLLFASDSLSFSFGHYGYILTHAFKTTTTTTTKYILLERTQHQQKHKCHQRLLLFSNMAEEEEQKERENVDFAAVNNPRQDVNIEETTTKTTTTTDFSAIVAAEEEGEEEGRKDYSDTDMPSLDDVLKRARKKKLVIPMAMIQSFFDAPLWIVRIPSDTKITPTLAICTRMDGLLIFVSTVFLHANGFALGLLIGKLTIRPVTKLFNPPPSIQALLLPSWTVFWAIGLDQVL